MIIITIFLTIVVVFGIIIILAPIDITYGDDDTYEADDNATDYLEQDDEDIDDNNPQPK